MTRSLACEGEPETFKVPFKKPGSGLAPRREGRSRALVLLHIGHERTA